MSTIIKFELKELKKLVNDKRSCVVENKVTQIIALQPWCLGNLKESIKNLMDYKIGKFDKELNGILLCYKNLRVLQNTGIIRNDNANINFQIQADYFIFQPHVGASLKGIVNKKSITHLAVLVHRVFNVVIARPTEEPGNKWLGASIEEGEEVHFKIVMLDLFGALPYIRGELEERLVKLGPDGDDEVQESQSHKITNVSYINFDKTKPTNKQIGDGLALNTSSRLLQPKGKFTENQTRKNAHVNGKGSYVAVNDSGASVLEKERNRKFLDTNIKRSDMNERQFKRNRKDT